MSPYYADLFKMQLIFGLKIHFCNENRMIISAMPKTIVVFLQDTPLPPHFNVNANCFEFHFRKVTKYHESRITKSVLFHCCRSPDFSRTGPQYFSWKKYGKSKSRLRKTKFKTCTSDHVPPMERKESLCVTLVKPKSEI